MTDPQAPARDLARQQLLVLGWFSPAFPIGGFAFSHGLEWGLESGAVTSRATLEDWLGDVLRLGSGRSDAVLLAATYRAALAGGDGLQDLVDLGAALAPSSERSLEATVQGQAFLSIIRAAYPADALERWITPAADPALDLTALTLPVAAGLAGAAHAIDLPLLLTGYLSGCLANLVSAGVRLGMVGQTDGQRIVAALHPTLAEVAGAAITAAPDDLWSATWRSDLFSLQHETQYSRLFRS